MSKYNLRFEEAIVKLAEGHSIEDSDGDSYSSIQDLNDSDHTIGALMKVKYKVTAIAKRVEFECAGIFDHKDLGLILNSTDDDLSPMVGVKRLKVTIEEVI